MGTFGTFKKIGNTNSKQVKIPSISELSLNINILKWSEENDRLHINQHMCKHSFQLRLFMG